MNEQTLNDDWLLYGTIIRFQSADGTTKRVDPTKVEYWGDCIVIPPSAVTDDESAPVGPFDGVTP